MLMTNSFSRRFTAGLVMTLATLGAQTQSQAQPEELAGFQSYTTPAFPFQLSLTAVKDGYADVAFTVGDDGQANDAVILAASHPLFGDAVLDALRGWRLAPAASSSVPRREVLHVDFRREGGITTLSHLDAAQSNFPRPGDTDTAINTLIWDQLTTPPEKIAAETPVYPQTLRDRRVTGKAAVNFVIDTDGKVRIPVVVAADAPEFGTAALKAVRAWRFTPPTQEGKPVLVESTRVFTFGKAESR